jgi:hypothetical protein
VERSHKISEGDTLAHAKRLKPQRCLDYARHDKEGVMLVMTNVGRLVLLIIIDNKVEILTINGDVENVVLLFD